MLKKSLATVAVLAGGLSATAYAPDCDELRSKAEAARDGARLMTVVGAATAAVPLPGARVLAAVDIGVAVILDHMSESFAKRKRRPWDAARCFHGCC